MAGTIPTPRSYQTLLGDMIASFVSRYGVKSLRVGPLLGILEAAAQSDARSASDFFQLLDARNIDRATGQALDRLAAEEDLSRRSATAASDVVSILDTSFEKISSKIYPGATAPNAGTSSIKISDGSLFPSSGSIYLGRGTINYEGPISYSSITQTANYWELVLASPTQKAHNPNETVILAQGGDRVIPSGTLVNTAKGNAASSVSFATISAATIPDGETRINNVSVICQEVGIVGNVPKGAIIEFSAKPFVGASVTNVVPFNNGRAVENDTSLRERIKNKRRSRALGTALALITNANGVQSSDGKTVISSSVFSPQGEPTTLYIDDGTGYEETTSGVPFQTLADQALGGEDKFALGDNLPVSKAFVATKVEAPFVLTAGAQLAVKVGGVLSQHTFEESEFKSILNATAYEIVSVINGNPDLLFSARTTGNGSGVVLFARADTNEDIEVIVPDVGIDANESFGFPAGVNYTLRLYKDDTLLFKDGRSAIILSAPQSQWDPTIASGVYIKVKVDGTKARVYKITDQNFIDSNTGYTTVNYLNSLESWATVFNAMFQGVTVTVSSGRLQFVSNRGNSSTSALVFSEPSVDDKDDDGAAVSDASNNLIQMGMFTASNLSSFGQANDYSINKNTGELKLTKPLTEGQALTAGSKFTRAYLQSEDIASAQVTFTTAPTLWFMIDGDSTIIPSGIGSGISISVTAPAGSRRKYATSPSTAVFQNIQKGDWALIWDDAFSVKGAWRVAAVDPSFTYFEVERENTHADETVAPQVGGILFVRGSSGIQQVSLTTGTNRSLSSIADELTDALAGATASVSKNTHLRITTNTYGDNGSVLLLAANTEARKLQLPRLSVVTNSTSHFAAVETTSFESGTPCFDQGVGTVTAVPGTLGSSVTASSLTISSQDMLRWLTKISVSGVGYGNNVGLWSGVKEVSGTTADLTASMDKTVINDRIIATSPFAIAPDDNLLLTLDNEVVGKSYNVPMWRTIKPVAGQIYGATNFQILDSDNGGLPLSTAFGSMDFSDFAIYMHARGKSHAASGGSAPAGYHNNKAILWRFARMGAEGNKANVAYVNPTAPNQGLAVSTINGEHATINVSLPSGAGRTGLNLFGTTKFTVSVSVGSPSDTVTFSFSKPSATLTRISNVVTATTTSAHGFVANDVVYVTSSDANFPSGAKTVIFATSTTFTYNEVGTGATSGSGQFVSGSPSDPDFSNVAVGDIVSISASSGLGNAGAWRVTAKTATSFTTLRLTGTATTHTTPVSLGSADALQFFPINTSASKASDIVTWINTNATKFVSAVAVENGGGSPGTGAIDRSTLDEYLAGYDNASGSTSVKAWPLTDGINYVQSSNLGATPNTITMKNAVSSDLVSNTDLDNETMKLVPITTRDVIDFLSSPAVSGLYASSSISTSTRNTKAQVSSLTVGGNGSVQVTGGTANGVVAAIVGSGVVVDSTYSKVSVLETQAAGLTANQYVSIQGEVARPKVTALTSASKLTSIAASGQNWVVTFDTDIVDTLDTLTDTSESWQIDKVGSFALYHYLGTSGSVSVSEGDWVVVSLKNASPANSGTFRVVRKIDNLTFWVENSAAVSEVVGVDGTGTVDSVNFYSADSVMVGDTLTIDTTRFGVANRGTFKVVGINDSKSVIVSGSMEAYTGTTTLGTDLSFVRFIEAEPIRLIKRIWTIGRTPNTTNLLDIVFDTSSLATRMLSGATITALDKLAFPTALMTGVDAYNYSTGLIGEVNRVLYGDPENPSVYPGVVAAGAYVNLSGPLIRRIEIGLAIRTKVGAITQDVINNVKSAVASVVNNKKQGESVAISDIVAAAESVESVASVLPISPSYATSSDLIAIQPSERARVLDADRDITVSIIGN